MFVTSSVGTLGSSEALRAWPPKVFRRLSILTPEKVERLGEGVTGAESVPWLGGGVAGALLVDWFSGILWRRNRLPVAVTKTLLSASRAADSTEA